VPRGGDLAASLGASAANAGIATGALVGGRVVAGLGFREVARRCHSGGPHLVQVTEHRIRRQRGMHVFVAGAAGAIGTRLVPQLVQQGHRVTATTRNPDKLGALRALGAEPVIMDGLDATSVAEAVARARPDAIVHQMTALAAKPDLRHFDRWFATTNQLRTTGTDNLLAAAAAADVKRFVAQSYTGWTNPTTGAAVKTESDPLDPEPLKWQRESIAAIRSLEETVPAAPLDGIVLRYGNFYGPGASEPLVELVRKRRFPLVGDGGGVWSWIHLDDAASATVAALERGGRGVYNIVDDEPAPTAEWLPYLADAVGAKPPMRVPVWLARLMAGAVPVRWMTEGRGDSNAKAKRELGWTPTWRSWRDGFRDGLSAEPAAKPIRGAGPTPVKPAEIPRTESLGPRE
jgi:nucleoside-diphosphate-sugar epimerase